MSTLHNHTYHQTPTISHTKSKNEMLLISCCSCICPIHWSQVLSREWRCNWTGAAPTTSEWSTILLPEVRLILEVWRCSKRQAALLYLPKYKKCPEKSQPCQIFRMVYHHNIFAKLSLILVLLWRCRALGVITMTLLSWTWDIFRNIVHVQLITEMEISSCWRFLYNICYIRNFQNDKIRGNYDENLALFQRNLGITM